jgi:drug/metabolite transporter (DMT)-like permease
MALTGAIVLTVLGPFFWIWPTPADWLLLFALAGLGSVGHLAIVKALQIAPASFLQPFSYSLLLWATLVGFIVFGDVPDRFTMIGGGIVVASGLFAAWRERSVDVMPPTRNSEAT